MLHSFLFSIAKPILEQIRKTQDTVIYTTHINERLDNAPSSPGLPPLYPHLTHLTPPTRDHLLTHILRLYLVVVGCAWRPYVPPFSSPSLLLSSPPCPRVYAFCVPPFEVSFSHLSSELWLRLSLLLSWRPFSLLSSVFYQVYHYEARMVQYPYLFLCYRGASLRLDRQPESP